mmetsp:Transcript_10991/g.16922  ORF Transcript_10991/g.16922 Transcript_10991/m.16922 type:complete len:87 (+) Transcript_10991:656-916(+)
MVWPRRCIPHTFIGLIGYPGNYGPAMSVSIVFPKAMIPLPLGDTAKAALLVATRASSHTNNTKKSKPFGTKLLWNHNHDDDDDDDD